MKTKKTKQKSWYEEIDAATLQRIKAYSAFNDAESKNLMVQTIYEYREKEIEEFKETNHELAELAIARNKRITDLEQKNKDLADCNGRLLTQAAAATKRVIQLEKDNWHDLRKDPKDLPDEGTYLIVWQNARGYKERMIMRYEEDDEEKLHWIDGEGDCWDDDVIAWREIPKFEEAAE